ncbi:MAG: chemotaxis-specific protein-glutamate methyltransferase CheB [Methanoculleaceae archaeon]
MIRVLVVDDSLFVRTVVRDMLQEDPSIEVIGTATDGLEAIRKVEDQQPDVITLDVHMPRMNGLEAIRRLKTLDLDECPKILMLSTLTREGARLTEQALHLGADDFMLKPRELTQVGTIGKELVGRIKNLVNLKPLDPVKKRELIKNRETDEPAECLVAIGSSAGGPQMLDQLCAKLDPSIPASILITQHIPVGFSASLAKRLDSISQLPVVETVSGMILKKGTIAVSCAGYHTIVSRLMNSKGRRMGKVIHSLEPPVHSVRPAVDRSFLSAASVFGPNCLAIILSGMGDDGGEGAEAVKQNGGKVLVCREKDCLIYGMPRSAIERGVVDAVVPLEMMAQSIRRLVDRMGV